MEQSWYKAERQMTANARELVEPFGFNVMTDDLNVVINGKNRNTFNKDNLWYSYRSSWHREGLGVWDFLLRNSHDKTPVAEDVVKMWRIVGNVRIDMECRVIEAHLQTPEVVGKGGVISSVSGRSVIELLKITISILENDDQTTTQAM